MMNHSNIFSTPATADDLIRAELLVVGEDCVIHASATFMPRDLTGTLRPIILGAGLRSVLT